MINTLNFIAGWMPCHWQEVLSNLQGCCWLPCLGQEGLPLQGSLSWPLQEGCWMPSPWRYQVPSSGPREELQLHCSACQVPDNCKGQGMPIPGQGMPIPQGKIWMHLQEGKHNSFQALRVIFFKGIFTLDRHLRKLFEMNFHYILLS